MALNLKRMAFAFTSSQLESLAFRGPPHFLSHLVLAFERVSWRLEYAGRACRIFFWSRGAKADAVFAKSLLPVRQDLREYAPQEIAQRGLRSLQWRAHWWEELNPG